jgi:Pro-kumamolisin, activation domain/Fibronectin type III domain
MNENNNSNPGAFPRRRGTGMRLLASLAAGGLAAGAAGAVASSRPGSDASAAAADLALVSLPGHVHRLARGGVDAGEAPDATQMHGLDLVLAKTPAQEKALDQLLADQQDSKSAQYHHWLSPAEFGRRFGASDAAIHALSGWLKSYGLETRAVPVSRSHLPFSGTKAQVEAAFHTQIHEIDVQGERHYANVSDPMVPASVQPMIRAVRGLNDFNPKPGVRPSRVAPDGAPRVAAPAAGMGWVLPHPNTYYSGSNEYPGYVGPSDFAVIYNLKPLYQNNTTGVGVTVAIAAQSDVDANVLTAYWAGFGVAGSNFGLPAQSFTSIPVPGGTDPGQTRDGNEDEAYLDTEILGGLAPGAKLILVRDMSATNAAQYVIDQNLAAVLNISFGSCESAEASENAAVNSMYQQAVSEGISITVSSADAGAAACTAQADLGAANDVDSNGFAVNGLASTPYNLAVGGTDFNDLDSNTDSTYWSTTNQPGTLESALSHIPEMVWNDSCANPVFAQAYGIGDPIVFCNTATLGTGPNAVANPFILISGGGGGLSSCTTTDFSGNCSGGYPQPSWQANVLGITNFGTRALPDVSMIATRWLVCSYENATCNPANAPTGASSDTIEVLDGTSASAPSVAAIIALVDQSQIAASNADGRQGLINTQLYQIAGVEYGSAASLAACSADQGAITSAACAFYDVVSGSNAQPCNVSDYAASSNGSLPASTCANESNAAYKVGVMEVSGTQDYAASPGFDLATGLGSINAAALLSAFQASAPPTGLKAAAAGTTVTLTWTADAFATHGFDVYQGTAPGLESSSPVQQEITGTTATVIGLQAGLTYDFKITAGTAFGVSPYSNEASATLAPVAPTGLAAAAAGAGSLTLTWTASSGATTYNLFEGTSAGGESAAQTGISSNTTTLTALAPGQQYFFKLEAVNAGGPSAQSAEANGTVLASVPAGLSATAGNGSVSLTWTAAAGAKTYTVYDGKSSGGEGSTPVMTGLTGPSATVTGLSNGTPYYFTVGAVDAGGTSAASAEAHATPVAPSGGGGAMDWIGLGALAAIAVSSRKTPSSRRRAGPRRCR